MAGYAALAAITICLGFFLMKVLLSVDWIQRADGRVEAWIVGRRAPSRVDASWVWSTLAGGVVIPVVLGVVIVVCTLLRWWRSARSSCSRSQSSPGAYRLTTIFVHRQRPDVDVESLPVNASFPSGHVAASIALYCGLALPVTSRTKSRLAQVLIWLIALAIPPFVGLSRLLRGMHNPTDAAAGVLLGIGALLVVLFAARLAGTQSERRARGAVG